MSEVTRYSVWPVELMEIDPGNDVQDGCDEVVMASTFDSAVACLREIAKSMEYFGHPQSLARDWLREHGL